MKMNGNNSLNNSICSNDNNEIESKQEEEEEEQQQHESSDDDFEEDNDINNDKENIGDYTNNNKKKRKLSLCSSLNNSINLNHSSSSHPELQKKVIIVERSALSAITIFAKNLLDTGFMTKWEYSLLERFYSIIEWEPGHILYLRVDPEICCSRIQRRNRDGENNVNPTLIQNLHNKHEKMFYNANDYKYKSNIIIVDGKKNTNCVLQEALDKIANLESKI